MNIIIMIANLVLRINSDCTIIIKSISMRMTANVHKTLMILFIRAPVFFRHMGQNNRIFFF